MEKDLYTLLGITYIQLADLCMERGNVDFARQHLIVARTSLSESPFCLDKDSEEKNQILAAWRDTVASFNYRIASYKERGVLLDPILTDNY